MGNLNVADLDVQAAAGGGGLGPDAAQFHPYPIFLTPFSFCKNSSEQEIHLNRRQPRERRKPKIGHSFHPLFPLFPLFPSVKLFRTGNPSQEDNQEWRPDAPSSSACHFQAQRSTRTRMKRRAALPMVWVSRISTSWAPSAAAVSVTPAAPVKAAPVTLRAISVHVPPMPLWTSTRIVTSLREGSRRRLSDRS